MASSYDACNEVLHFILSEKIEFRNGYLLLSAYDIRDILIRVYSKKKHSPDEVMQQIIKRHEKRVLERIKKDFSYLGKVELGPCFLLKGI